MKARKEIMKNQKAFYIPGILESLKTDYDAGLMTLEQVAHELYHAGWMNYISIEKAKDLCGISADER